MAFLIISMTFVFLRDLGLKLIISKKGIIRLSFVFIPILVLLIGFVFLILFD